MSQPKPNRVSAPRPAPTAGRGAVTAEMVRALNVD
jgi:hypothetical protein